MQALLIASETRLGTQIRSDMGGLEERLGHRIGAVETAQKDLTEEVRNNTAEAEARSRAPHRQSRSSTQRLAASWSTYA
jgi:hypothetical protein